MARESLKDKIVSYFSSDFMPFYRHYINGEFVRRGKNQFCQCPFHEDTKASFSINGDGRWYCHAEKMGGDIFSFYGRKFGLASKSDFPQILKGIARDFNVYADESPQARKPKPQAKIVKEYDYVDATGKLLFQVVRFEPKDFRQRKPKADGNGWVWNLQGIETVLYNLPAVIVAQEIFLVEGEKDADILVEHGLTATTNPQGAKKWKKTYTRALEGKDIVIIPDNDGPGKEHMQAVAKEVSAAASSVKMLELPNINPGGDVHDWLRTFNDKELAVERLSQIVDSTANWEPRPDLDAVDACDFAAEDLGAQDYLIEGGILPREAICVVGGGNKQGKSILMLNMAVCLCRGMPFLLQFPVKKKYKVLYIQAEVGEHSMQDRTRKVFNSMGKPPRGSFYLINRRGLKLDNREHLKRMDETLEYYKPDVLMLDPLYKFHSGNENSVEDMGKVFDGVDWLMSKHHCSCVICHHLTKPSKDQYRQGADQLRGSSSIFGWGDTYMTMNRVKNEPRNYVRLTFDLRNEDEPAPLVLYRNPETLAFEVMERQHHEGGTSIKTEDVVSIVKEKECIVGAALVEILKVRFGVTARTCLDAIRRTVAIGRIQEETLNQRGRPKQYRLVEKGFPQNDGELFQ